MSSKLTSKIAIDASAAEPTGAQLTWPSEDGTSTGTPTMSRRSSSVSGWSASGASQPPAGKQSSFLDSFPRLAKAARESQLPMSMKNSFLHFEEEAEPAPLRRVASAPGRLAAEHQEQGPSKAKGEEAFEVAKAAMAKAHDNGNCSPCHYFAFKADGCRTGDRCRFCHRCSRDAIMAQKAAGRKKSRRERMWHGPDSRGQVTGCQS